MSWPTRLRGLSEAYGSWKTICICRRSGRSARRLSGRDVAPLEDDLAAGQLVQAHDAAPERRLAAARLAHEPERLARPHLEGDRVDGLHLRHVAADHAAALDREVLRDLARLEQRLVAHDASSGWIVVSRRARFSDTGRKQRSRCPGAARSSSAGRSVQAPNTCGQRGANEQPEGRASSDGGRPGMAVSRRGLGRSMRGIEPSSPQRVRMLRVREQLALGAVLDDPARVHHAHAIGEIGHHAHVVRDHDDGRAEVAPAACAGASRICAWIVTSSAVVGSSAIRRSGLHESAIAIIARCRMPPENWCG